MHRYWPVLQKGLHPDDAEVDAEADAEEVKLPAGSTEVYADTQQPQWDKYATFLDCLAAGYKQNIVHVEVGN